MRGVGGGPADGCSESAPCMQGVGGGPADGCSESAPCGVWEGARLMAALSLHHAGCMCMLMDWGVAGAGWSGRWYWVGLGVMTSTTIYNFIGTA